MLPVTLSVKTKLRISETQGTHKSRVARVFILGVPRGNFFSVAKLIGRGQHVSMAESGG
jgi:hypothetical protein